MAGGTIVLGPLSIAAFSNDPTICFGGFFFGLSPAIMAGLRFVGGKEQMSKRHKGKDGEDWFGIRQAGKIKAELSIQFKALGLQKGYVDKNFPKIVRAFAAKERDAREDDELADIKRSLGLTSETIENAVKTLESLQRGAAPDYDGEDTRPEKAERSLKFH